MDYEQVKHGLLHGLITRDRFRLQSSLEVRTSVTGYRITFRDIDLYEDGTLTLRKGYTWDGASGPTWDTHCTMRASAVHDALYRLIVHGKLPVSQRWKADGELWKFMRLDGANWFRALYYFTAVQIFGRWWIHFGRESE